MSFSPRNKHKLDKVLRGQKLISLKWQNVDMMVKIFLEAKSIHIPATAYIDRLMQYQDPPCNEQLFARFSKLENHFITEIY